jgi:hypothetical protein
VSDGPLPHYELSRRLEQLWREQRRALLAEHGVNVRRPLHDLPPDAPERPATAAEWARAICDVCAIDGGPIDVREMLGLADRLAVDGRCPFPSEPLDEALHEELRLREAEDDDEDDGGFRR